MFGQIFVRVYSVVVPSTRTRSRGNLAFTLKTLPVRRWHTKQWQIEIRTGSPSQVTRTSPQAQVASRVVIATLRYTGEDQRVSARSSTVSV
jgi:hypothetical protein